ncbi:hypothetical protein HMI49_11795 [Corallococcus exercitus]|uniref:Uncharacterized protein n=1 Tax=Corallococcus exercitus TaxID=2316736 RepID=A0A7Y4KHQ9_9BACT|nr:hypothetical protein [Corallococcus exercitus]NOK33882.1 hypothetical protein [Corallococcus exercitus]
MDEQEADNVFRQLISILGGLGLGWVAAQVLEQVRVGQTKRESVPMEQLELPRDTLSSQLEVPRGGTRGRKPQRKKEELIKTLEYSRKDRLRLLLDGIKRTVIQTADMESEATEFFRQEKSDDVRFEPDEEEPGEAIRLGQAIGGRKEALGKLGALISELREQIDAN